LQLLHVFPPALDRVAADVELTGAGRPSHGVPGWGLEFCNWTIFSS
jgi:hypothetical protein